MGKQALGGGCEEMVAALPVPAVLVDGDGKVVAWNAALEAASGRGAEQMVGKRPWPAFHAKRKPTALDDVLDGSAPAEEAVALAGADGERRAFRLKAVPFQGGALGVLLPDGGGDEAEGLRRGLEAGREAEGKAVEAVASLTESIVAGDLAARADLGALEGVWRDVLQGFNDTLDAVIGPLNVAAEYVDRISKGDLPEPIVESYNGDFNAIKDNLNRCLAALSGLITEMNHMSDEHNAGDIDAVIPAERFEGAYRAMAEGVNDMVGGHIAVKKKAMACVAEFGRGNFEAPLERFPGKKAFINDTIEQVRANLKALIADAAMLSEAAVEGRLETRADATKHHGDFRKIVQGVNDTLDAVIGPLNVAAEYVDRISKGDLPEPIVESYNGDFNAIKENLNRCLAALSGLIAEMGHMSAEHNAGDIDVAIPAERFEGAYRVMAEGVNDMVGGHIAVKKKAMACVAEFGRGNFEAPLERFPGKKAFINDTIEQVRANLKALIADAAMLSEAAVAGRLETRADATKHHGDFRKIVQGVNDTLDAVIGPVMEASEVLEQLAAYDLRARVVGDYEGDHARIKDALNASAEALHDALAQVATGAEQVSAATRQIAASSVSVAEGASEQASALEETSSSLEQMSSMTQQNADNTIQAKALAATTKQAAEKGGTAMERMTDAMEKIRAASESTSQIIRDINDIAFQTNLLALNAAVEAARAGDAGRGFAVVAEEVRNLALRSKEAAKKTEDLIKVAVGHAEHGRAISKEAAASLSEIVTAAGKVNDIVQDIAVASQEQSRGIEQVNKAVAEMDKVVQASAANAEESSSAAEELAGQAEELTSLVARFTLDRRRREDALPAAAQARAPRLPARGATAAAKGKSNGNGAARNGFAAASARTARQVFPLDDDPDLASF